MVDLVSSGGGERESRRSRTRLQIGQLQGPQVQMRMLERPVAEEVNSRRGLESLGQSFANFFGAGMRALDTIREAEHQVDLNEIRRENEAQQQRAIHKALFGEELTEDETRDRDYVTAYRETLAKKTALELAQRFNTEIAPNTPLDQDINAAMERFVREELRNGDGIGTGDEQFDNILYSAFAQATAETRAAHSLAGTKYQLVKGREDHDAYIVANFANLSASDLPRLIQERRDLNPLAPQEAAGQVMNALIVAAGTSPEKAQRVLSMIHAPGSGNDNGVFAQQFPQAALEIEEKLTQQYLTGKSWEGTQMYQHIKDLASQSDDIIELTFLAETLLPSVRERFGEGAQFDSTMSAVRSRLDKVMDKVVDDNKVTAMISGQILRDDSHLRAHLDDWMAARGLNPYENPELAGQVVSQAGAIGKAMQSDLSFSLTDLTNPERVASAVRFYYAIEQDKGEDVALSYMEQEAQPLYQYLKSRLVYQGANAETLVANLQSAREDLAKVRDLQWSAITGDRDNTTATSRVRSRITSAFSEAFGEDVSISETAMQDLMSIVKSDIAALGVTGSWKEITDNAATRAARSMTVYPGPDGKLVAEPTMIPDGPLPATDAYGMPLIGEDGSPVRETPLKFGLVPNPNTGQMENTIQTFRQDARALAWSIPDAGLSQDNISLDGRSAWASKGVWLVRNGQDHVVFGLGETYRTADGKVVEIPNDPDKAMAMVAEGALDGLIQDDPFNLDGGAPARERFRLIPFPEDGSLGFILGYVPGFRHSLPTVADLERKWTPPSAQADQDFESRFDNDPAATATATRERMREIYEANQ